MPKEFTKENLDLYLLELAKEFRKLTHRKAKAEILLVGGASVLINYSFRNMTTDFDALIDAPSTIKDAINTIGNRFDLPKDWINEDFRKTSSYSSKLREHAKYYREFANTLSVYTISNEYLVAMKLQAGRHYKNDLSDIVGILSQHAKSNKPLTLSQIQNAYHNLYGEWEQLPEEIRIYVQTLIASENLDAIYDEISEKERSLNDDIKQFNDKYPGVLNNSNASDIIQRIEDKMIEPNKNDE